MTNDITQQDILSRKHTKMRRMHLGENIQSITIFDNKKHLGSRHVMCTAPVVNTNRRHGAFPDRDVILKPPELTYK